MEGGNPFSTQVGGSHYKGMKIQPVEFILANGLGFCEGNIIKYTCRYGQKGGVQDLKKVIHYAELLIRSIEAEQEAQQKLEQILDDKFSARSWEASPRTTSSLVEDSSERTTSFNDRNLSVRLYE